jgi:hypothetical protein
VFTPVSAIQPKFVQPAPWHRSISKLSSFVELSVQVRFIWPLDAALAERFVGAAGAFCVVLALAMLEYPESSLPAKALTR